MSDHEAKQATSHATLLAELLDSRVPKSEREHAAAAEIERLREMLARLYAGSDLYCDDGELQDARAVPFIDFKRDSAADIRCAMVERNERKEQR